MPIQIIWGNDLNGCNKFIQEIIEQKVSKEWMEKKFTQGELEA